MCRPVVRPKDVAMRLASFAFVLSVVPLAVADDPPAPKPEADQRRFQGAWQFVAVEQDANKLPQEKLGDGKWVFEGDKSTLRFGTQLQEGKLTLDPSKDPRHIDIAVTAGPDKGTTYRGIYKFVDDELVLCFPGSTKAERPKEFSGKAGNGQAVYVLKKKKD
jgi:uncharacterized protein (TIGR03067 family)